MSVHPLALWVSKLSSQMSLRDQRMVSRNVTKIMYGGLIISLLCGYMLKNVNLVFYWVAAGTVLSLILYVPNWYQHDDEDQQWRDEKEVREYYNARQKLLDDLKLQESELEKDK